jgi:hypothetical protein
MNMKVPTLSVSVKGDNYRHQSVARASFVDQQDVPRAEEFGLGRDAVLTPYIPPHYNKIPLQ